MQVELAQARGSAQLSGSVVQATVGEAFELFVRLTGPSDEKVRVEVNTSDEVEHTAAVAAEEEQPV